MSNYLKRLEKARFEAFDPTLQRRDGLLALQVWWNYYRMQF